LKRIVFSEQAKADIRAVPQHIALNILTSIHRLAEHGTGDVPSFALLATVVVRLQPSSPPGSGLLNDSGLNDSGLAKSVGAVCSISSSIYFSKRSYSKGAEAELANRHPDLKSINADGPTQYPFMRTNLLRISSENRFKRFWAAGSLLTVPTIPGINISDAPTLPPRRTAIVPGFAN
jgi:hypothetical protein